LEYFHASTDDVLHIHLSCLFITSNLGFFWTSMACDWRGLDLDVYFGDQNKI
jgi:hypothetical protein